MSICAALIDLAGRLRRWRRSAFCWMRWASGLDAMTGLYRSLLAGRQMLILLDNARDGGQLRPLLPGGPGCLVVVTSRSELTGLTATDGAWPVRLGLLTDTEAGDLLTGRLGAARRAGEPAAADQLIRLCGGLPLA